MGHVRSITTKKGTRLRFWFNSEGAVVYEGARTLKRYRELGSAQPPLTEWGCWAAFSKEAYGRGERAAIEAGLMKEGEKVYEYVSGVYGTERNIMKLWNFHRRNREAMARECDPQEVYFYEYNNYECCYAWDGDRDALDCVKSIFGEDVIKDIVRI